MELQHDISCIRKDRKMVDNQAHGGVALFFYSNLCSFTKFHLNSLKGPEVRDFEILACKGRMRGVKREIVVFSCYLPPGIGGTELARIQEALTDAISEAKLKANSPWMIIGGDFNSCLLYTSPSPRD